MYVHRCSLYVSGSLYNRPASPKGQPGIPNMSIANANKTRGGGGHKHELNEQ